MAFAELKRLKAKIRQGSATEGEIEKYRDMTDQIDLDHRHPQAPTPPSSSKETLPPHFRCPVPGVGLPEAKRQRMMVNTAPIGLAASARNQVQKEEASKLVQILRRSCSSRGPSPPQPPTDATNCTMSNPSSRNSSTSSSSSSSSNVALLNALRASKATRGHHQQSKTMFASRIDVKSQNEEEAKARRLTGIQGTATILCDQSVPPALSGTTFDSSSNTSTNMSATHMLRRLGNPHRRVVHQMLREQHERILRDMKRTAQEAVTSSGVRFGAAAQQQETKDAVVAAASTTAKTRGNQADIDSSPALATALAIDGHLGAFHPRYQGKP